MSSVGVKAFSFAYNTSLALRYLKRVFIVFWRLCALHIRRCDDNLTTRIPPAFIGGEKLGGYLNWGYKYPFELACHLTFTSKSFCTHTLNLVKCPVELTPSFSIKSLPDELFLTSVSFLFSLTYISSSLSPCLSCPFLSCAPL